MGRNKRTIVTGLQRIDIHVNEVQLAPGDWKRGDSERPSYADIIEHLLTGGSINDSDSVILFKMKNRGRQRKKVNYMDVTQGKNLYVVELCDDVDFCFMEHHKVQKVRADNPKEAAEKVHSLPEYASEKWYVAQIALRHTDGSETIVFDFMNGFYDNSPDVRAGVNTRTALARSM